MSDTDTPNLHDSLSEMVRSQAAYEAQRKAEAEARIEAMMATLMANGMAALYYTAVLSERDARREAMRGGTGIKARQIREARAEGRCLALRHAVKAMMATPADPKGYEAWDAMLRCFVIIGNDEAQRTEAHNVGWRIFRDL